MLRKPEMASLNSRQEVGNHVIDILPWPWPFSSMLKKWLSRDILVACVMIEVRLMKLWVTKWCVENWLCLLKLYHIHVLAKTFHTVCKTNWYRLIMCVCMKLTKNLDVHWRWFPFPKAVTGNTHIFPWRIVNMTHVNWHMCWWHCQCWWRWHQLHLHPAWWCSARLESLETQGFSRVVARQLFLPGVKD